MRFIEISESGCWMWLGYRDKDGYGNFNIGRKTIGAHRAAWILFVGSIPKGKIICHHCDNPPCVNPEHLYMGSYKSNSDDKIKRNRTNWVKGERQGGAKLTQDKIREIRHKYASGAYHQKELAKEYLVTQTNISHIIRGISWSHI